MNNEADKLINDLLVVVVLYNLQLSESVAVKSLSGALRDVKGSLFVYDNSPYVQRCASAHWNITYAHDPTNPGVSKAYNEAFKKAKELKKKWMLVVDQDTFFPEATFSKYFLIGRQLDAEIIVPILKDISGMVSPLRFYLGGGQRIKPLATNCKLPLKEFLFHNSGLLISTNAFEIAGGYDEKLPLDFSDFSFVNRLRKKFSEFSVANIECNHDMASTSFQNIDQRLQRFKQYVKSARYFQETYDASSLLLPRVFVRAIKLSWHYHSLKFIFSYFRE